MFGMSSTTTWGIVLCLLGAIFLIIAIIANVQGTWTINLSPQVRKPTAILGLILLVLGLIFAGTDAIRGFTNVPTASVNTPTALVTQQSLSTPIPTPTPSTTSTSTSAQWVLVDASFGNWPQTTQSNSGCSYSNNVYHDWLTTLNNGHVCQMSGRSFADVDFQVSMQIQPGECGGIVFRADAILAHYYDVVICPGQNVSWKKRLSAKANDIAILDTYTQGPSVNSENKYIVKFVALHSSFSTFVNGEPIPTPSDNSGSPLYTSGLIGVITVTQAKHADISFSNPILLVWQ
jgi:hypothetical protein